jgi:hypothetical protein
MYKSSGVKGLACCTIRGAILDGNSTAGWGSFSGIADQDSQVLSMLLPKRTKE